MRIPPFSLWPALLLAPLCAFAQRGPVPGFNAGMRYLAYYGTWDQSRIDFARLNYKLVILEARNITAAGIASIRSGPDAVAGNADDVVVLGYISTGEDDRPAAPYAGTELGPRVDPRPAADKPSLSDVDQDGKASPGGTGYASYYLDDGYYPSGSSVLTGANDGEPDQNPEFLGYYVNQGDPIWFDVLKTRTKTGSGSPGLDELLTSTVGQKYACDGLFIDTLDTAAPNSWHGTQYEWTAPGCQTLIKRISDTYPTKILAGNRGLFFYNPNFNHYAWTLRPYLNMVCFESYRTGSSGNGAVSGDFDDNRYNFAPKLNAEAGRPDGFTIFSIGYTGDTDTTVLANAEFDASMKTQGWMSCRTNRALTRDFITNAPGWNEWTAWSAANPDTAAPVWDSTAATTSQPPAARTGLQQIVPGDHSLTLRWDVARDQTGPVRYNIYTSTTTTGPFDFATATKRAAVATSVPATYALGTGTGRYPYEFTLTGLTPGVPLRCVVRAVDAAAPVPHEDTNTVELTGVPNASSDYRSVVINGSFTDWAGAKVVSPDLDEAFSPVDFAGLSAANDARWLYLRFSLHRAALPFSDFRTHLFIDTDNNAATGFQPAGFLPANPEFGSEFMVEGSTGYDERNRSFSTGGSVPGVSWTMSPGVAGTDFEARLNRFVKYPDGTSVFPNPAIRLLLGFNDGDAVQLSYTFRAAAYSAWLAAAFTTTELADPLISGDAADPDRDGLSNFTEFAFGHLPRKADAGSLASPATVTEGGNRYPAISCTRPMDADGLRYVPAVSTDLGAWDRNPLLFVAMPDAPLTGGLVKSTWRLASPIPSGKSRRYLRIEVNLAP